MLRQAQHERLKSLVHIKFLLNLMAVTQSVGTIKKRGVMVGTRNNLDPNPVS
jgi:hypothetical protein